MELTCINCANKFEVGDEVLSKRGATVRCPTCGTECVFHGASSSQVVTPLVPPPSRTSGFRRPMQVFVSATKTQEQPKIKPDMQVPRPKSVDTVTPKEVPKAEPVVDPIGDGKWYVRCPTGLELVFPSSQLVLAWATVVDDPRGYFVSRGGDEFVTMAEWIEKVRQGSRSTVAFKTVVEDKEKLAAGGQAESKGSQAQEAHEPKISETPRKSVTYQLQFKTRDSSTQKRKKVVQVLLAFALLALLGGAVFGAHFLGLF